jgi:hypothetical protein
MSNNFMPSNAPDPEVRQRMVADALKGSKLEQSFKDAQPKTDKQKMQMRLAQMTVTIIQQCVAIKKAAIESGKWTDKNEEENRDAILVMAEQLWQQALQHESKESLHYMICLIQAGITLEQVDSCYFDPII